MNALVAVMGVAAYLGLCAVLLSAQDAWFAAQDARVLDAVNESTSAWFCTALAQVRASAPVALTLSGTGPCAQAPSGRWQVVSP